MNIEAVVEDILLRGSDDLVQAAEVAYISSYVGGAETDDQVRDVSLQAIRQLLLRNLVSIGDVIRVSCSQAWGGQILDVAAWDISVSEAVDRVDREWKELGRRPGLGELFWLKNTELGNQMAQRLFDRHTERDSD